MKYCNISLILVVFITMLLMTACRLKGNIYNIDGDSNRNKENKINIDETNVPEQDFSSFDVDSVLYENAIQNEEPVVDIFYDENIYAFYGNKINVFDYNTRTELQTIFLEGLENVKVPVIINEESAISEETETNEARSNTYVTAFTIYKNDFYVISDKIENRKTETNILRFDSDGKYLTEYPVQIDNVAEKIVIKNDKAIILSVNVESIHEPQVYFDLTIYNFLEQKQSKVNINKVLAVTLTDNNKAAITTIGEEGHNNILLMDLETQNIEKEANVDNDYIMDMDYKDNKLYILSMSDVFVIDSELTTPVALLLNNYVKATYNRKIKLFEDELVIMHSSNHLLLYDFKSLEQKEVDSEPYTITILTPYDADAINNLFGDYVNELKNKYPNINLKIITLMSDRAYSEDYNEEVAKKLIAKDTDFDLYFMLDNDNIIKSYYYEDLNKYQSISRNLDIMLPGIKDLMCYNNKIYGVPVNINFGGFRYHSEYTKDLGLQFPSKNWTISDFYDFAINNNDVIEKNQKPLLNFYHVLGIDTTFNTSFYINYLQGVELNSEDLATHFEKLKKLLLEKLISVDLNYMGETIIQDSYINSIIEAEPRMASVITKENCRYLASVKWVSLNPSSPNKELAIELLTAFTDSELRKKSIFQTISSQMQYDNQLKDLAVPNVFHHYTELDRFESFALFKELLKKSYRNIEFQGRGEVGYLFEEFINGKRTAKSAADEIIQRLNMIKYE